VHGLVAVGLFPGFEKAQDESKELSEQSFHIIVAMTGLGVWLKDTQAATRLKAERDDPLPVRGRCRDFSASPDSDVRGFRFAILRNPHPRAAGDKQAMRAGRPKPVKHLYHQHSRGVQ
jgi:hypothetical protein